MVISWNFVFNLFGALGGAAGFASLIFLICERRQKITINRVPSVGDLKIYVTNRSLRPIPIQSIKILCPSTSSKNKKEWVDNGSTLSLEEVALPGLLNPEQSAKINFERRDTIITATYDAYQIVVTTQTGKQIKETFPTLRL